MMFSNENFPSTKERPHLSRHEATGLRVVSWSSLRNRAELLKGLAWSSAAAEPTDAQLLLEAWRRWGPGCAAHLLGEFAFVVTDTNTGQTYLARDPMGVKPLYYRISGDDVQHAFSAAAFAPGGAWQAEPDMDWAARYLLHLSDHTVNTAYQGVFKLPPGHWLCVGPGSATRMERYFEFRDDAPPAKHRQERWVEEYRSVLEEAIRCRMLPDGAMATENSGGIDSATITAYLARFLGTPGERLHSFGFAMAEQEPAFILETSQAAGITHNYIVTGSYGEARQDAVIARGLAVLGYPQEHGNAGAHTIFYRECQLRGITALFSGFGGDEVVTNPGNLLRYELLDAGDYRNLWDILPGDPVRRVLRMGKAVTMGRRSPAYRPTFFSAWNARWPHQLLRDDVVQRLGLHEAYMETARFDAPYRRINDFILQYHLHRMQVTTRLENCTLMAAAYGVDYRWPLWDVRLVQQYLSTPSIEKEGPRGIGRYLHRRAIDGVVPKRVAWKPSKDMGYAAAHERHKTSGMIQTAEWARRHEAHLHPALQELIDREKFKSQIARALQGGADPGFDFSFHRAVNAIAWLNHWLYAGKMPG